MKKARRELWGKYISEITHQTASTDMYRKIRKISGLKDQGGRIYTDQQQIAQLLFRHFKVLSDSDDYTYNPFEVNLTIVRVKIRHDSKSGCDNLVNICMGLL
jgi:hypothetical protein